MLNHVKQGEDKYPINGDMALDRVCRSETGTFLVDNEDSLHGQNSLYVFFY
jgi:hypothetical protein